MLRWEAKRKNRDSNQSKNNESYDLNGEDLAKKQKGESTLSLQRKDEAKHLKVRMKVVKKTFASYIKITLEYEPCTGADDNVYFRAIKDYMGNRLY